MKGQMFILFGVLTLLMLLMLRISTPPNIQTSEPPLFDIYQNLRAEAEDSVDLSLINGQDPSANLGQLMALSQASLKRRGIDQQSQLNVVKAGQVTKVDLNLTISAGGSYISDRIIIQRTQS